jgi:hypothetical protein
MEETGCNERHKVTVKPICMEILKEAYLNIHLFDFLEVGKLNLKEILYFLSCFISEST